MAKPPRQSGRKVSFTPETAQRIVSAVGVVEKSGREFSAIHLPTSSGGDELVRATFTGDWAKGEPKTCSDAVLSSVTYKAKNYLVGLAIETTGKCVLAYCSGEWVLVGWDWSDLSGYSASSEQILSHDGNGNLAWLGTTSC